MAEPRRKLTCANVMSTIAVFGDGMLITLGGDFEDASFVSGISYKVAQ